MVGREHVRLSGRIARGSRMRCSDARHPCFQVVPFDSHPVRGPGADRLSDSSGFRVRVDRQLWLVALLRPSVGSLSPGSRVSRNWGPSPALYPTVGWIPGASSGWSCLCVPRSVLSVRFPGVEGLESWQPTCGGRVVFSGPVSIYGRMAQLHSRPTTAVCLCPRSALLRRSSRASRWSGGRPTGRQPGR